MALTVDGARSTYRRRVEVEPPRPPVEAKAAGLERLQDGFERARTTSSRVSPAAGGATGGNPPIGNVSGAEYKPVEGGELFVKGEGDAHAVSATDIRQGAANDCWFLSSLGVIAEQHPELIEQNLRDNGDGTYTVTFYEKNDRGWKFWEPEYKKVEVTVDGTLPMRGDDPVYADTVSENGKPETWVAIYEKAYAKYLESYGNIEPGNGTAGMRLLTGADTQQYKTGDVSATEAAEWLANGDGLTAVSLPSDKAKDVPAYEDGTLMAFHVYYVTGVDPDTGTVSIQNPHGWSDEPIQMSWEDFQKNFVAVDHGELP